MLDHAQLEIGVPTPNAKETRRLPRDADLQETLEDSDAEESLSKTKKHAQAEGSTCRPPMKMSRSAGGPPIVLCEYLS